MRAGWIRGFSDRIGVALVGLAIGKVGASLMVRKGLLPTAFVSHCGSSSDSRVGTIPSSWRSVSLGDRIEVLSTGPDDSGN